MKRQLLLGCGNSRKKLAGGVNDKEWGDLVTLDFDPNAKPDVLHDLAERPWPFPDDDFDEVHAYEVLEHLGRQGDWRGFFDDFAEIHRILKPGGVLFASSPAQGSQWVWGDPGHTREISAGSIVFLSQKAYAMQVGETAMTDYRHYWKRDFDIAMSEERDGSHFYALRAVK